LKLKPNPPIEYQIKETIEPTISTKSNISKIALFSTAIIVVIAIAAFFFLRKTESQPSQIDKVKEQISKYYQAIENNNVEVLDYYLQPIMERWYDRRHVTLKEIKIETSSMRCSCNLPN
jgi:uncharacterized membrane protein YvbJ